MGTIHWGSK